MFARMALVTCLALLFLMPVANGGEASRGIENGPAVSDVSKAQSMAERELEIGRYDMSRGNYAGAINRFKMVVERFPSTAVVDEALFRLVQAYLAIGIRNEAQTAAGVLNRKFPQSHWRSDVLEILQKAGLEPIDDEASWIIHAFR
jgi:outer membrane protein assembly factor BamD